MPLRQQILIFWYRMCHDALVTSAETCSNNEEKMLSPTAFSLESVAKPPMAAVPRRRKKQPIRAPEDYRIVSYVVWELALPKRCGAASIRW